MPRNARALARVEFDPTPDGSQAPSQKHAGRTINDLELDLGAWKKYPNIVTDSLWLVPERDHTGAHAADYHGNFIPQIPHQMMLRYTHQGDIVLDPFLGMGTTMIEAQRLGRHAIGIELQTSVAQAALTRVQSEPNPDQTLCKVICGDSSGMEVRPKIQAALQEIKRENVQLVVLHPPYHDIIHFSKLENDLSNARDLDAFLEGFGNVVRNCAQFLEKHRYLVLVIGDKYADGEWVPLGSRTMDVILKAGFTLKSWVVKNMTGNRAKRNLDNLWRYRALRGGFFIFKHEHVLVFRKG